MGCILRMTTDTPGCRCKTLRGNTWTSVQAHSKWISNMAALRDMFKTTKGAPAVADTCIADEEVDGGAGVGVDCARVGALHVQRAGVDNAVRWLAHAVLHGAGPLVQLQPPQQGIRRFASKAQQACLHASQVLPC